MFSMVDNFGCMVEESTNQLEYLPFGNFFLLCQLVNSYCMRVSLSGGKHASILLESRIIPKKGIGIAGPSIFSDARGTSSFSHVLVMMFEF